MRRKIGVTSTDTLVYYTEPFIDIYVRVFLLMGDQKPGVLETAEVLG
jgi:hypothetical protein